MARGSRKRRSLMRWVWRWIRRQPTARPCADCLLTVSPSGQVVSPLTYSAIYTDIPTAPRDRGHAATPGTKEREVLKCVVSADR